ncbi:MAG: type II toxin-antitoxin system prevent-host-death family antitoxin [Gammaproteobacteria bacterium]
METINIHEAKTHLSRLVEQAAKGEPFIIAKAGKPLVMVVPLDAPAGLYPEGATPEGLHDLAGNAWEWTRTLWGTKPGTPHFRYPYEAGDGREDLQAAENIAQVLRGGAFNGNASYVRCAYRYRRHVRLSRIGFRVVVCP